ncbi:glycoside hydrolase [Prolixibacteraceae bacterium JC049]|nr:glycoside hydrolase [Prolixibacteraceae bacterium JC049]
MNRKMRYYKNILIIGVFLMVGLTSYGQEEVSNDDNFWPEITQESKPWTRWWWLGSNVDESNLRSLLKEYASKGLGGVEITPIYGVKGEESTNIDFLTPEWIKMLNVTVDAAHKNGMGVDMNTGTGWPFGGPTITNEYAAKKLQFHQLNEATQKDVDAFIKEINSKSGEDLLAISAYNANDERVNLLEKGKSVDDIKANYRKVVAVTQKNTGQKVKRAAPGAEGLVFNHFSEKSTNHYLKKFDDAFSGNPGVRCFFNDSYELSSASGATELFDTFKKLKGYDLALYAKELSGKGASDKIARVKADYRDVLGEMLLANFTQTWTNWAAKYGAKTKNQAHGSPGNLIDLYAAVGIPELETFHSTNFPFLQNYLDGSDARHTESNPLFKKFASSAAHQKGENLVSCETHTWLNEHFKTPLYQCKPELDDLFIKGVTHLFFHGTAYSPKRAAWPGWLFYASIHIEPNNPQWDHIQAMNEYIARCQSVLQQGVHTNDFLMLWSPDDYNHDAGSLDKKLTLHNSNKWVNIPEADELLKKGFQFDFTTDRMIQNHMAVVNGEVQTYGKSNYKTVVVPHSTRIKLETFKKLLNLANNGANVIFSNWPKKVVGFKNYKAQEAELAQLITSVNLSESDELKSTKWGTGKIYLGNVEKALKDVGVTREKLLDFHVKNISRKMEDGYYYFIANHENKVLDRELEFKFGAQNVLFMDPLTGDVKKGRCQFNGNGASTRIYLPAGSSMMVYFTEKNSDSVADFIYPKNLNTQEIKAKWNFKALKGGPKLPAEQKNSELKFWTDFSGDAYSQFAGMAQYTTSFSLKEKTANIYKLKFENVETTARVFINGKEAGTMWCFPYELDVTQFLQEGKNDLRVEVCNLGANRIRYMDQKGITWKKFHNINIVNLRYKKLDASGWKVLPSGLSGKVELVEQAATNSLPTAVKTKKKVN